MRDDEFLDSNLIRAFPFVENINQTIPNWLIVDFRAVILDGNFDPEIHNIFLAWIVRVGNKIRFGFRTDAPDLSDQELVFERDLDATEMATQHVISTPLADTIEARCGCSQELLCDPNFTGGQVCSVELLCDPNFEGNE